MRAVFGAGEGLAARYFTNTRWSGYPALTAVDPQISTLQIAARWHDAPPPEFSVRWLGYLTVWRAGTYGFLLSSDNRSRLYIDDRLVSPEYALPSSALH